METQFEASQNNQITPPQEISAKGEFEIKKQKKEPALGEERVVVDWENLLDENQKEGLEIVRLELDRNYPDSFNYALSILKDVLPKEILQDTEINKRISENLRHFARNAYWKDFLKFKNNSSFLADYFENPETKDAIKSGIARNIEELNYDKAEEMKKEFGLTDDDFKSVIDCALGGAIGWADFEKTEEIKKHYVISDEAVRSIADKTLDNYFSSWMMGQFEQARETISKIKEHFDFSDEEIQAKAKKVFLAYFSNGKFELAGKILTEFNLQEYTESPEFQKIINETAERYLENGEIDNFCALSTFGQPSDTPQIREKIEKGAIAAILRGDVDDFWKIKGHFDLPNKFLNSSEVKNAAKKCLIAQLALGHVDASQDVIVRFNLDPGIINFPEVQGAAEEGCLVILRGEARASTHWAVKMKKQFRFKEDFLSSDEVQGAAEKALLKNLSDGGYGEVLELQREFGLPEDFLDSSEAKEAAKTGLLFLLNNKNDEAAVAFKEYLKITEDFFSSPEAKEAINQLILHRLKRGDFRAAKEVRAKFNVPEEFFSSPEAKEAVTLYMFQELKTGKPERAIQAKAEFNMENRAFDKCYEDFGEFINFDIYKIYEEMLFGRIPESLTVFNIKQTGEGGLNQFKQKLRELQGDLLSGKIEKKTLENSAVRLWAMKIIGYENSRWGQHDAASFEETVNNYFKNENQMRPLPKEYKPSEILSIPKIDKENQEEFQHTPAFLNRYNSILLSLKEARVLGEKPDGIIEIFERLSKIREEELERIEAQILKIQNPETLKARKDEVPPGLEKKKEKLLTEAQKEKALVGLQKQKETLLSLDLKNLEPGQGPQEIFKTLSSFKAFENDLRTMVFMASYGMNPQYKNENIGDFNADHPSVEELSWVMNFTDHITNQETFSKYFSDKESLKRFNGFLNISALGQEMARIQNQNKKGVLPFQFVPSRNLLMEFSGHIADACWADKYKSIVKQFPNFISLIMVQNPDKERDARLAGASMLIETESKDGEPLLVIRGLNPKENVINQLSVEDFYNKIVNYLKPIAEKQGRKLAIVIDNHSGGAATNRPILFNCLSNLKNGLEQVRLKSSDDTSFNGYNIVNDVYLVE